MTEASSSSESQERVPPAGGSPVLSVAAASSVEPTSSPLFVELKNYLETRMVQIETEMIKRHNTKMLNEMQEVVRQIKTAKTKNDDMLRDYNKKLVEVTQLIAELTEKVLSSRADLDELKRTLNSTKQSLSAKTEQISEQVNNLRTSVLTTWQKEKTDIQNRVYSACRADLSSVLSQCDTRLRENFVETHRVKHELKRILAKLNNEDPDSVVVDPLPVSSPPLSLDAALPAPPVSTLPSSTPSVTLPSTAPAVAAAASLQPATPLAPSPAAQQAAAAAVAASAAAAGVQQPEGGAAAEGSSSSSSLAAITQQLAALAARHQSGGQPLNVATLQQFMANIPKSQQLQLQAIIQQKVQQAQAQRAQATSSSSQQQPQQPAPSVATNIPGLMSSVGTGQALGGGAASTSIPSSTQLNPNAPVFTSTAAAMPQTPVSPAAPAATAAGAVSGSSGAQQVQCPFFSTFAWCKYQDKCKYLHVATGKEPLRDLPASTIAHLQQHLSPAAGQGINSQVLASVLAAAAARLQAQGGTASASAHILNQLQQAAAQSASASAAAPQPPVAPSQPAPAPAPASQAAAPTAPTAAAQLQSSAVAHAMVQAQMQAQQEAQAMGAVKAKQLPCRFNIIGRCAYGERCAYNHALTAAQSTPVSSSAAGLTPQPAPQAPPAAAPAGTRADPIAAATAAAWGKSGLSVGAPAWGPVSSQTPATGERKVGAFGEGGQEEEENQIVDGEDDKDYDQWNAATFGGEGDEEGANNDDNEHDAPPPGLGKPRSNK